MTRTADKKKIPDYGDLSPHERFVEARLNEIKSLRLQLAAALDALRVLSTCHEKTCCSDRGHKCTCFASIAREGLEAAEKIGGKG
jgi:hypothetical protein